MALILRTPPTAEPVSLSELKGYCRIDPADNSQDDQLLSLAMAARAWCEAFTQRRFVQQTWRLLLDFFPGYIDQKLVGQHVSSPFVSGSNAVLVGIRYAIALPHPPVKRIVNFEYDAADGTVVTLVEGAGYTADLQSNPARLMPLFGQVWPVARVQANAVRCDFEIGYAFTATLSVAAASKTVTGHTFASSDVGRIIDIPGAGLNGGTLSTFVAAVDGSGVGTLAVSALTAVTNATALVVNAPNGIPYHWALIKTAIKMLALRWYEIRIPDESDIPAAVKAILTPVRDLRVG